MSEADYSKWSGPARLVPGRDEDDGQAGDFYYVHNSSGQKVGLVSCLPNARDVGDPTWGITMFSPHGEPGRSWTWDGNLEKPTLTPSIHRVGHWHGYLRDGFFQSC